MKNNKRIIFSILFLFSLLPSTVVEANDKRFDFRVNPLNWALGAYDLELNYHASPHVMFGPVLSYWRGPFDEQDVDLQRNGLRADFYRRAATSGGLSSIELQQYGLRADYFWREAFRDGPYISAFYDVIRLAIKKSDKKNGVYSGGGDALYYGTYIGYRWNWDHTNINLGVGYAVTLVKTIVLKDSHGQIGEIVERGKGNAFDGIGFDITVGRSF